MTQTDRAIRMANEAMKAANEAVKERDACQDLRRQETVLRLSNAQWIDERHVTDGHGAVFWWDGSRWAPESRKVSQ